MKKIYLIVFIIIILTTIITNISYAENIEELQNEKQQIKDELSKANEELEHMQIELTDNLTAISKIDLQIQEKDGEWQKTNEELEKIKQEINVIKEKLNRLEKSYNKQKDMCEKRLVALYEMGKTTYLDVLLNSKNITEFISNYYLIGEIAEYDNDLLDTIQREKNSIETISKDLNTKNEELNSIKASEEKTLVALENARTIRNSYVNSLSEDEKKLKEQADECQNKLNLIDSQILFLTVGEIDSDYVGGEFLWPTPGYKTITSYFGTRLHPILKTYRIHYGIDIGAPNGAYVVAANSGVVTTSSYLSASGNAIIIDHGGGVSTLYAHASELIAQVGDKVEKGDVIMKVGSTGLSTGPHLHFGISINGKYVDPLPYLKASN